jgi:enamine deaminase RidA (YjgF/YER057c/UK114 family)
VVQVPEGRRIFSSLTVLENLELGAYLRTDRDVIRRDIERDYDTFNRVRTAFYAAAGLDPLPASTAIQARICRTDLLVEIEAMALLPRAERR